ncbi:hypothetical protein TIFTF001_052595, partial [Ficus carica]
MSPRQAISTASAADQPLATNQTNFLAQPLVELTPALPPTSQAHAVPAEAAQSSQPVPASPPNPPSTLSVTEPPNM